MGERFTAFSQWLFVVAEPFLSRSFEVQSVLIVVIELKTVVVNSKKSQMIGFSRTKIILIQVKLPYSKSITITTHQKQN